MADECGIKIPVSDPKTGVSRLMHGIECLARDPDLRVRLAEGLLRRFESYSWQSYGANLAAIYTEALCRGGSRRGFLIVVGDDPRKPVRLGGLTSGRQAPCLSRNAMGGGFVVSRFPH